MKLKKRRLLLGLITLFGLFACAEKQTNSSASTEPAYTLVWADEFDDDGLPDSTKWSFDTEGNAWGWGNNDAQHYTANRLENAEVKNGVLRITTIKEDFAGKNYTSARLLSKGKGDWLYGKFEIRAQLPEGRGLWPAIWMLPTENEYGNWPASGEIDIMENVGYMPDTILASSHTNSYNHMIGTQRSDTICIADCYDTFHVYCLEWEPQQYKVSVDDEQFFTFKNEGTGPNEWPYDKPFHLLLNVAVGGNWGGLKGIDDTIFPQSMLVDYVRVYQKKN